MPSNCVPEKARCGSAMTRASQPRSGFFRLTEDAGRLGAALPRQASALVDVVVGGDDLAVRGDQPRRRVGLPAQAVGRVLEVVGRGAGVQGEAGHAASPPLLARKHLHDAGQYCGHFGCDNGVAFGDEVKLRRLALVP